MNNSFLFAYRCSGEDCYDLLKKYEKCSPSMRTVKPWCPIDVNLILPMHEAYGRMPGLFQGGEVSSET